MSTEQPQSKIDLSALVHARELTDREVHEALRDIRGKLRFGRRVVPTIGEIIAKRATEQRGKH